jgi:hypothetical protein
MAAGLGGCATPVEMRPTAKSADTMQVWISGKGTNQHILNFSPPYWGSPGELVIPVDIRETGAPASGAKTYTAAPMLVPRVEGIPKVVISNPEVSQFVTAYIVKIYYFNPHGELVRRRLISTSARDAGVDEIASINDKEKVTGARGVRSLNARLRRSYEKPPSSASVVTLCMYDFDVRLAVIKRLEALTGLKIGEITDASSKAELDAAADGWGAWLDENQDYLVDAGGDGMVKIDPELLRPDHRRAGHAVRRGAAPAGLRRVHRPGAREGAAHAHGGGGEAARRHARPCAALRAARSWQDDAGPHRGRGRGLETARHERPPDRARGRSGGHPHEPAGAGHPLH